MVNNYDNAASFYDRLSQMVFGRALINAQVYLLQFVPPDSNLLIVGGGTGWILEELTNLHSSGLKITYVEISAKMMQLSRQRYVGENKVSFVNSAIEDVDLEPTYDVIITPFLFDNFKQTKADNIFIQLNTALKPGGMWLYADFESNGKWWHAALLKTMHVFFRMLCRIEASQMPDVNALFKSKGYQVKETIKFYWGFISAICYVK